MNKLPLLKFIGVLVTMIVTISCEKLSKDVPDENDYMEVSGVVLDSCDGAPLSNLEVIWDANSSDDFHFKTYTDDAGRFEFKDLPRDKIISYYYTYSSINSEIQICLEGDMTHTIIAYGSLGETNYSEGAHDSNGDLGNLYAHTYKFEYRLHIPKYDENGHELDFHDYDTYGGYGKVLSIDSSHPTELVLHVQGRASVKLFYSDADKSRPEHLYDGAIFIDRGEVQYKDEESEEWVYYRHDRIQGEDCDHVGDYYVTFHKRKPF